MNSNNTKTSTKDRIFKAAVELFLKQGYQGTSMRDLAGKVGIKESSLYNHFSGKGAILEAILEYQIAGFQGAIISEEEMEQGMADCSDPVELWLAGVEGFIMKLPPLSEAVSHILFNEMYVNEQCRRFVLDRMLVAQKNLTEMLLTFLRDKGMIKDCDIRRTAEQYVYMIYGLDIENRLLRLDGHSASETQRNLLEHITLFIERLGKQQ